MFVLILDRSHPGARCSGDAFQTIRARGLACVISSFIHVIIYIPRINTERERRHTPRTKILMKHCSEKVSEPSLSTNHRHCRILLLFVQNRFITVSRFLLLHGISHVFPSQVFAEVEFHDDPESEAGECDCTRITVRWSPHRQPDIRASDATEM